MASPLRVRRVRLNHHETSEYITQKIYLPVTNNDDNSILIYLYRELYIINNLRAKILIRNNIIGPKNIIIDVVNKQARIKSCNAISTITTKPREEYIRKRILAKDLTIISLKSEKILATRSVNLLLDRDFIFKPTKQVNLTIFTYLIDYKISAILIRNDSNSSIQIFKKLKLEYI